MRVRLQIVFVGGKETRVGKRRTLVETVSFIRLCQYHSYLSLLSVASVGFSGIVLLNLALPCRILRFTIGILRYVSTGKKRLAFVNESPFSFCVCAKIEKQY